MVVLVDGLCSHFSVRLPTCHKAYSIFKEHKEGQGITSIKGEKMHNPAQKTLAIIVLISVFFPLGHAHADYFVVGNDLVEYMREYEKIERGDTSAMLSLASRYTGYVTGVYDATRFQYSYPPNVTRGQLCAIVAKYLKEHPERWNQPASDLVIEALKQAFPKER
jgi:hypothetical protein